MTDALGSQNRTFPVYVVIIEGQHQPRTTNIDQAAVAVKIAHSQGRNVECKIVVETAENELKCVIFTHNVNRRLLRSNWGGDIWNKCSVIPHAQFRFQI